MSAETTPADVIELVAKTIHDHWQGAPGLSARPWDGEKGTCAKLPAQAEDFRRKARAVMEALATRPAEPAALVAEARDGEVSRYIAKCREMSKGENGHTYTWWSRLADLLSTLETERARADELRRLLTASGRCVDDLTARLDAFEHAQEKARDEGFNHALSILEDALGSPTYYAADGSETWEGDTRGTIYNLLRASGVWRGDDDMLVTKDRDFWKERFQVESRSRIQAEQRAADALARAEKGEDWQPIRTAPMGKNGIAFMMLAFGPPGDQTVSEGMHFNGRFYAASVFHQVNPSDGRHFVFREHEVRPTHWRPTLAPPRASREAQPATDGGDNG